jgi:hypothetical protein
MSTTNNTQSNSNEKNILFCDYLTDFHNKNNINIKSKMKKEDKASLLREEILSYFEQNSYNIKSDIYSITSKSQPLTYICKCLEEKTKTYKDILRRECRTCKQKKHYEVPTDYSVCPSDNSDEKWVAIEGGFISNLGNAINFEGKKMTLDEKGRYYFCGKLQYASILMAKSFELEKSEKLLGQKSNFIVRNNSENIKPTLNDIYIGTRNEIGKENGTKARKSENFKELTNKNLVDHIEKFKYVRLNEFPNHIFFEDGNIYNNKFCSGGQRFLCFSTNISKNNSKTYKYFYSNEKSYKVHRLICMAFHPIKGKETLDDYKDLQVNHIDGNTLNNQASNLEWSTKSENINHAYETNLNKKVRAVLQFVNNNGEYGDLIEEYKSLAEASRQTLIPEYEIREVSKRKGNFQTKKYLWKYKNEEENEEWTKKFSSKNL